MDMVTRTRWLEQGLEVLATEGLRALTIERLGAALGLSKGSFYHHFPGMPAFRTALLLYYESAYTVRYIEAVDSVDDASPEARLRHLLDLVLAEDRTTSPEVAIRTWALQDPEARSTVERVDRARIDYLRGLWRAITGDEKEASDMATLLYVVLIGSEQLLPQVETSQLRRLYGLLFRLAPS
jgi:AcrR family transcriptional regulator